MNEVPADMPALPRISARKRREVLSALESIGILKKGQKPGTFELIELDNGSRCVAIPAGIDYPKLSNTAIKVLIACYATVRNYPQSEAFRLVITQERLARIAGIGRPQVSAALRQLEKLRLIKTVSHNDLKGDLADCRKIIAG